MELSPRLVDIAHANFRDNGVENVDIVQMDCMQFSKAVLEGLRDADLVQEEDGAFRLIGKFDGDIVKLLSKGNEERRTQDRRRLDGMIHYATQLDTCRVAIIREYFEDGERTACARCDICQPKLKRRRRRARPLSGRGPEPSEPGEEDPPEA